MRPSLLKTQRGLTFIELTISLLIAIMAYTVILRFIAVSQKSLLSVENRNDLILAGRRASYNISNSVSASGHMYGSSTDASTNGVANAYFTIIKASVTGIGAPAVSSICALPKIFFNVTPPLCDPSAKDGAGNSYFGNCLLFAAAAPPITMTAYIVIGGVGTHQKSTIRIDQNQFVLMYLAQISDKIVAGIPGGRLALVEWRSKPFPSWDNISSLSGVNVSTTAVALYNMGYRQVWDCNAGTCNAFYDLSTSSPYMTANPVYPGGLPASLGGYSWGEMPSYVESQSSQPGLTAIGNNFPTSQFGNATQFRSTYSVAYNTSTVTNANMRADILTGDGGSINLPQCAAATAAGFPAGFEVMVTGPASGRELCGRLTIMASSAATTMIGAARVKRYLATQTYIYGAFHDSY